jgi:NSS family neurotransmitter:Na+ symporter
MTIASLTSSISMLEVPVAYIVENKGMRRTKAAMIVGAIIISISIVIVFNFDPLFDMVVNFTTERVQPLLSLFICIFAAWIWRRNEILDEIRQGNPGAEHGIFWKIWPFYIKFICPLAILAVYFQ